MSNPSPYDSQGGQNTPWPQYGENAHTAAPQGYSGAAYGGGYAGPTAVVMPDMPSRAPGVVTLVIGVLLMIIVAPHRSHYDDGNGHHLGRRVGR